MNNMAESQKKRKTSDSSDSTAPNKKVKENFSWTDDKIKLLLDPVKDFKAKQEFDRID